MLELFCAKLIIYIKDKEEEVERLSKFFHLLKTVFDEENEFLSNIFEFEDWFDKMNWYESRVEDCPKCAKARCSSVSISLGDYDTGLYFQHIEIYENYKIQIYIGRKRGTGHKNNACLESHHKLISLFVENETVDVGYIFPGLLKENPKWYTFKNKPSFYIGKRNFILFKTLEGYGVLYEKEKNILGDFMQKNWDQLNKKDDISILTNKEAKKLLKEPRNRLFFESLLK